MNLIQQNIPLKGKTSYKIGGPARFYAQAQTQEDIQKALQWAVKKNQPVFLLGKGSNILISDTGWPGLVIDLSEYSNIRWSDTTVECQSGSILHTLVKESVDRGFTGMEKLVGIPGSIGGGLIMNAGAFGQTISDCLVSVTGIHRSDASVWCRKKSEISFGYRTSSLIEMNSVIIKASFKLKSGDREDICKMYKHILMERAKKQPLNMPSCGSVFKRPQGMYAGELIEQCGLKGHSIGGVMISQKHANFIVTTSEAKASEVRRLIALTQERVYKKYKVLLEPEVIFVGAFDIPLYRLKGGD